MPLDPPLPPRLCLTASAFALLSDGRLSSTRVTDDDYAWLTAEVAAIGGGNLPIVSVLEGGYNVEQLAKSVRVHLKALISS